jgi:hypothetical protein
MLNKNGATPGEEYCLGCLCPREWENQHILVTRTRNYAPKLPPLSGLRTIALMSQYLTYGVLGFQAVRAYESSSQDFGLIFRTHADLDSL